MATTSRQQGRDVYNNHCYFCHGYDGDARTVASRFLTPRPRDFTAPAAAALSRSAMVDAVTHGRPGSAMMSFAQVLSRQEIEAVVDFIRDAFIERRKANTRYHTAENGWSDYDRYSDAFPFALGALPVDTADADLTPAQRRGKQLFLSTCVVCHDRGRLIDDRTLWERRTVSYPRGGYSPKSGGQADATSGPSLSAPHELAPVLVNATAQQRRGEKIFQKNCAFCHAPDGTGRNWIGSFIEPRPRDLTAVAMSSQRLRDVIRHGLPDSTMPAWGTVLGEDEIAAVAAYVEAAFVHGKAAAAAPRSGN
jgi:cytochrome c oxidase cbb3-type subunit 3